MSAREVVPPGGEEFSRRAIDKDVVLCFVGEQEDPAFFVLHHFVAVVHRSFILVGFAPLGVHGIEHSIVSVERTFFVGEHVFRYKESCGR